VAVWPASGGAARHLFTGHEGQVVSLAWSADGATLVSGSLDGHARVWDLAAGAARRVLGGGDPSILALHVLDETGQVRAVAGSGTVRLWDLATGRERQTIPGTHGLLTAAVLCRDGRLATGNGSGDVRVRGLEPGGAERTLPAAEGGSAIGRVAFTPDGRFLLAATHAGEVRIWDARGGAALATLASGAAGMEAVAVDPAGRCIATAGQDRLLRLWRTLPADVPRVRLRGLCGIQVEDGPAGPLVAGIMEGKPAAGRLQAGDRIKSVDGIAVRERTEVVDLIGRHFAGDAVVLVLERGGTAVEVRVTLVRRDGE
jgi:WD40 repeat protein